MKKIMQICWLSNTQTFTVKISFTVFLALGSQLALAQLQDDFSDNDFSVSPAWSGTDSLFTVSDQRLKLNDIGNGGVAYLATFNAVATPATWEFSFSYEFNPSSANHSKVYLTSDQADLSLPINGYFVMIGASNDEISLYKQSGSSYLELIDGRDDLLNQAESNARVRITRDGSGWKLFTDATNTGIYFFEGSSDDNSITDSKYFGIVCNYTSTRSDKFFFDDFNVSATIVTDTLPPSITEIKVVSDHELRIAFSEPVKATSANDKDRYTVDDKLHPTESTLEDDQRTVSLTFAEPFSDEGHEIRVEGIEDLQGNVASDLHIEFIYVQTVIATKKDIIISEFLADPSPQVELGESEFVELFNRSDKAFNLSQWTLTDGSNSSALGDFLLLPKKYVVLTAASVPTYSGDSMILPGLPSLNNSSDIIVLKDLHGNTIDSINYSQSWYKSPDKQDGGWSLEIIDPENTCSAGANWSASEDPRGGTPGEPNSILASKPDLLGPKLLSAVPLSPTEIQLIFNEALEKDLSGISVTITPSVPIDKIAFSNQALTALGMTLSAELQAGIIYSIELANLKDCAGNLMDENAISITFGVPENADSLDVIINEILFNPRPGGVDFVEIFNRSSKFINLKDWSIANAQGNKQAITDAHVLLSPGEYIALTSNVVILQNEYTSSVNENLLEVKTLPSFNDDEGAVELVDGTGKVIDRLQYSEEMHTVFLKNEEGVSLERISASLSSAENWKSASSTVGFATPGYANSNYIEPAGGGSEVVIEPEIFNPLGGLQNFALIHYNFEHTGNVGTIRIFDALGRRVKEIANNDILGVKGFYRWDGDRDDGSKAALGYYMVCFEVFNNDGAVNRYLRRVAVACHFD